MKTTLEQIKYQVGDRVRIIDRDVALHGHTGIVKSTSHPMVFVEVEVVTSSGQRPCILYWPRELILLEEEPQP